MIATKSAKCHAENARPMPSYTCAEDLRKFDWRRVKKLPARQPKESPLRRLQDAPLYDRATRSAAVKAFVSYKARMAAFHYQSGNPMFATSNFKQAQIA